MSAQRCAGCGGTYVAHEVTYRTLDRLRSVRSHWYCHRCWGLFRQLLERLQIEVDRAIDPEVDEETARGAARDVAATEMHFPVPTPVGHDSAIRQAAHHRARGRDS